MKIRLNPIVKKDLQVTARSMRISWGLFAYEAVLTMTLLLALLVIQEESGNVYNTNTVYAYLVYLFPVLAVVQVCIVGFTVPVITASSISGEKERQTFDIMFTTCMSPFSIVLGKVVSAVVRIIFFVAASTPIMSLSFVAGGMSWFNLLYFVLTLILLSVFAGSIGIFCSSICRKSISAVILSFVFYFVFNVLTFIPVIIQAIWGRGKMGESYLILLFNPVVFFEEFFMHIMTGESAFGNGFDPKFCGFVTRNLAHGKVWMFTSAACILIVSVLFMLASAWIINPMHSSSGGRRVKKKKRA